MPPTNLAKLSTPGSTLLKNWSRRQKPELLCSMSSSALQKSTVQKCLSVGKYSDLSLLANKWPMATYPLFNMMTVKISSLSLWLFMSLHVEVRLFFCWWACGRFGRWRRSVLCSLDCLHACLDCKRRGNYLLWIRVWLSAPLSGYGTTAVRTYCTVLLQSSPARARRSGRGKTPTKRAFKGGRGRGEGVFGH